MLLSATACESDELLDSSSSYQAAAAAGGDTCYMAVQLVPIGSASGSTSASRATTNWSIGTTEEGDVDPDAVTFYFFDADGNACPVDVNSSGQQVNFVDAADGSSITWTKSDEGVMYSHTSSAILTLGKVLGEPAYVVAVLNDTEEPTNIPSLDAMREYTRTLGYSTGTDGNRYFAMSNAVYADENGNVVDAVPITSGSIVYSKESLSSLKTLTINVERLVAKVDVNSTNNKDVFEITESTDASTTATPHYVKINGWQLFDIAPKSYLLKNIRGFSSSADAWEDWNQATLARSYWAITSWELRDTENPDNQLQQQRLSWNQITTPLGETSFLYPFENTGNFPTKVIVAATLYEDEACTKPLDICRYLGVDYTFEGLQTQMAELLKTTLYVEDVNDDDNDPTTTLRSIPPEDIDFTPIDGCYVKVVPKSGVTYYDADGNKLTEKELNKIQTHTIDKLPECQIWKEGKCYYYANIVHINKANAIVRNHWYQLTLNSFKGLGTPVYDPEYLFDPTRPDDNTWRVTSTIKVREWNKEERLIDFTDVITDP
jgi:hypothetical protein